MRRHGAIALMITIAIVLAAALPNSRRRTPMQKDDGLLRFVVFGDSVARGIGDETLHGISGGLDSEWAIRGLKFVPTANYGIGGARTNTVLRQIESTGGRSAIRDADAIVLSIGGNDMFGDSPSRLSTLFWPARAASKTAGRVAAIVGVMHQINPRARIFVLGLYNPYRGSRLEGLLDREIARWDASLIARFARAPYVTVVRIADLFPSRVRLSSLDGFHPGAKAYRFIAARIAASIE